jgi:hypothetical protein
MEFGMTENYLFKMKRLSLQGEKTFKSFSEFEFFWGVGLFSDSEAITLGIGMGVFHLCFLWDKK